jgi:hypothetical protein
MTPLVVRMMMLSFATTWRGPGKITYMFSAERRRISTPRQASVGRASRQGSRKRKSAYVRRKMYMLIYPYPIRSVTYDRNIFIIQSTYFARAVSYARKVFMKLTTSRSIISIQIKQHRRFL